MTTAADVLNTPVTLPCGAVLNNRIGKAAMTEGLATMAGIPTPYLDTLYGLWSDGGAGMLLSGNIQIDKDHLERPGNVIIDGSADEALKTALTSFAKAATRNGNHFWAQISHGGRQTMKNVNPNPKAPSAIKLGLPGGQFGEPVALTVDEIKVLTQKFAFAAKTCQECGFTGVQIHAAHGYLLSSFLSPRANVRQDEYGGSIENRARFLREVITAVREAVGPQFPIAVKLNSADFQRGGFAFEDSITVAKWLEQDSVDLIEISGGNYEQPKLMGIEGLEESEDQEIAESDKDDRAQSTIEREAYFVDFAMAMQKHVSIPLMVTGGFRQASTMQYAIESGAADIVGLGRPMCVMTDAPNAILSGEKSLPSYENELALIPTWLGFLKAIKTIRTIDSFAVQYWFYAQLSSLGRTGKASPELTAFASAKLIDAEQKALLKTR